MTNIIIAIVIIAIIALLVVRSRQNKESSGSAKGKSTTRSSAKTTTKSTTESTPAAVETKAKPSIDINDLLTKIDVLITDKEYAKAEGIINQSLKQDATLHPLYEKLLVIYHHQSDDFAVKQLLDTLQKLNLNEVYQRIYNEHELFKDEQKKLEELNNIGKAPEVFEFTPSLENNTSGFDSLQEQSTDTATQSTEAVPETNSNDSQLLEFNFSSDSQSTAPVTEEPTLDFNLDSSSVTPEVKPEEPTLDFKFDLEPSAPPAEETTPTLDFNLDSTPAVETPASGLDFSLEPSVPETTSPTLDFNLELEPSVDEQTDVQVAVSDSQFADAQDPIVQSFTELSEVNPIDLQIELAEQYVRLGALEAAKSLLSETTDNLSNEQAIKIETLLQKIAS